MERETQVQLRVSRDEKQRLQAQAEREDLKLATWMRRVLLAVADRGAKEEGVGR